MNQDTTGFLISGIWFHVRPSSTLPDFFLFVPPHCLKKKGTPAFLHWSLISITHSGLICLAPGPDSPPTITQSISFKSSSLIGPNSGSMEMNLTRAGDISQQVDTVCIVLVLNSNTHPDVIRPGKGTAELHQTFGPLCQDLVVVLRRTSHDIEHLVDKAFRHVFMETGRSWNSRIPVQAFSTVTAHSAHGHDSDRKPVAVIRLSHGLEPPGHAFGIAVPAPGAYLRAAGDRVPGVLCPLNGALRCHSLIPQLRYFLKIALAIRSPTSLCEAKTR